MKRLAILFIALVILSSCRSNPQQEPSDASGGDGPASSAAAEPSSGGSSAAPAKEFPSGQEIGSMIDGGNLNALGPVISPNGEQAAYLYPSEFEQGTGVYLYDGSSNRPLSVLAESALPTSACFHNLSWLDDDTLLGIVGARQGTVAVGGQVYSLDIHSGWLNLLYEPESNLEQVISAEPAGDGKLKLSVAVYDKDFTAYQTEERVVAIEARESSENAALASIPAAENEIALLFFTPEAAAKADILYPDELMLDDGGDHILVVPRMLGTVVRVESMKLVGDRYEPNQVVYEKSFELDKSALSLTVNCPAGGPRYQITLTKAGRSVTYPLIGRGEGTQDVEVLAT